MVKGDKSDFLVCLLAEIDTFSLKYNLPKANLETVYIVDAMGARSFGDLPEMQVAKMIRLKPDGCSSVHFIGDRYEFNQTKIDERILPNSSNEVPEYIPTPNLEIHDWKLLMKNSKNKVNLLDFLSQMLSERKARILPPGIGIVLGCTFSETTNAVKLDCDCQYIIEKLKRVY